MIFLILSFEYPLLKNNIPYMEQVTIDGRRVDFVLMPNLEYPMFPKHIVIEATKQDSSGSAWNKLDHKLNELRKLSGKYPEYDECWLVLGGTKFPYSKINDLKNSADFMPRVIIVIYPHEWEEHLERLISCP